MIGIGFLSDYMRDYSDGYILIGGNACALHFEKLDVQFRETVDLDIVLIIESNDENFYIHLRNYIEENGYKGKVFNGSNPGGSAYRFKLPDDLKGGNKPGQIELFSKKPDYFDAAESEKLHITPIEAGEGVSNFSAILLDDEIYSFILGSKQEIKNVSTVNLECLLGLKSIAWHGNQKLYDKEEIKNYGDVIKHPDDMLSIIAVIDIEEMLCPKIVFDSLEISKKLFSEDRIRQELSARDASEFEGAIEFINEFVKQKIS